MEAREGRTAGPERSTRLRRAQLAQPRPAAHPLLTLQASAGNRAVTALMTSGGRSALAVQRDGPGMGTAHVRPGASLPFMATAKTQATALRGSAAVHVGNLALYNAQANLTFRTFEPKRIQAAERYSTAFESHARVLSAARQTSMNQDIVESIVIGAVASFAVAGLAAAFLPGSVLAAAAKTFVSTAGLLNAGGQAVASSALGTAAASQVATDADAFNPIGSGESDRVAAFRRMYELQSQARLVATFGPSLGMLLGNSEYVQGQVNLHDAGGETEMGWTETLELLTDLRTADRALQSLDAELLNSRGRLATLQEQSAAWQVPGTAELEKKIWVLWIAELSDGDVLDRDEIEDHLHRIGALGPNSLLGVDFGRWTSSDEEQEAISAARRLKAQFPPAAPGE